MKTSRTSYFNSIFCFVRAIIKKKAYNCMKTFTQTYKNRMMIGVNQEGKSAVFMN